MAILSSGRAVFKSARRLRFQSITTFGFLSQDAQIDEDFVSQSSSTPLPPNPASGSPLYNENWRSPFPHSTISQSLVPLGFVPMPESIRFQSLSQNLDSQNLMNLFSDWTTSQRWPDMRKLFEFWIRSLDNTGKPNKPNLYLYNHYLRAHLMIGSSPADLLDLVAGMESYTITPDTASFNLVLKSMYQGGEFLAAQRLLERMLQTEKESMPDDESYTLVIGLLFQKDEIDSALKTLDTALKYGYTLSPKVFTECVRSCSYKGRLETLVSIIEKCKSMDQNKALCPSWFLSNYIVDVAILKDNSKLAFYGLEFIARLIMRAENSRPPVLCKADEGMVVSVLGTAGRANDPRLLTVAWGVMQRSLRRKVPNPETYLAKIHAFASLGNLQRAFFTLNEFEAAYGDRHGDELFSPFSSLRPLVVACSNKGFKSLDSVYYQLENLSRGDPPYKSVAAINCIILGCANIWDLDRAYQTFDAISTSFGLVPDVHSYNSLISAFGKAKKVEDGLRIFEHMVGKGVKPNRVSYSVLVDAHLINRDQKSAAAVLDEMVRDGWTPSKEMIRRLRRRCVREIDDETNDRVGDVARKFDIRLGSENKGNVLFELDYSGPPINA